MQRLTYWLIIAVIGTLPLSAGVIFPKRTAARSEQKTKLRDEVSAIFADSGVTNSRRRATRVSAQQAQSQDFIGAPIGILRDVSAPVKPDDAPIYGKDSQENKGATKGAAQLVPLITCPQASPNPGCNLTYHGGSLVLGPHTTHVVYWEPPGASVTANYHTLIERYLSDVAADSGRVTNVYATDTQYNDSGSNFIQYQQTWGGSSTDTTAFPATPAGCPTTDGTLTVLTCLSQTQEATELDNFIQANGLPRGLDHIYFLILPDNVETCDDSFTNCGNVLDLGNRYCAYHSSFNISVTA